MAEYISRVKADRATQTGDPVLPRDFVASYPGLSEYLTLSAFPDGDARVRSGLTVLAGDGAGFKCVLNDPSNDRQLWATGSTLPNLLAALEALLCDSAAPWRMTTNRQRRR